MKIDKPLTTPPAAALGENGAGLPGAHRAAPRSGPQDDAVSLSERSRELQRLGAALAAEPAFDAAKVAAVKAAIAEGSFRVDAGRVADGLVAGVEALLAHRLR